MSVLLDQKLDELSDQELWEKSRLLVSNRELRRITPGPWNRRLDIIFSVASLLLGGLLSIVLTGFVVKMQRGNSFVESSQESPVKVAENSDSPFKILQATVEKVSGSEYSRLTGRTTNRAIVATVPEVKLVNTSSQTITSFVLVVRDPQFRASRGIVQRKVSIEPGETYLVKREDFIRLEKETVTETNQPTRQVPVQPNVASEDYWLRFEGPLDDVFVTVGRVTFSDGKRWLIHEEGDVK
jgi:hypothetical protein